MKKITLLLFLLGAGVAFAQPANDNYASAVDISALIGGCSANAAYTTVNATADLNKGSQWDSGPNYNVWFKFTATTNYMKVQLNTGAPEGTLQYPYLAMWATNGTTELVSMNRNGQYTDLEVDYYGLTPGVVYYVSVDNLTGAGYRGTFKLCLSDVADYNFYEGATDISSLINSCSADGAYTTVNATADKNKGSAWDSGPNYNRWFKFTATTNYMKVQLKTGAPEGTLQYPYLAMWATNGTTELVSMNRNGQYTDLEVDYYGLTPGVVYYVSVDNLTGAGYRGTFKLCLSDVADYNFYEGATDISSLINSCSADGAYTTVNATADKNKGSAWDSGPNYNRWFKFTATTSYMKVQLKTGAPEGTLQYPYLAMWATNGTTELVSMNRNGQYTDLEVDYYGLTPGVVYYVSVDNLTGTGYRGTFKLCLSDVVDYNFYEGATDISSLINSCSADGAYTTVNATADKNKGSAWDSGPNYNRWFKFTATTNYMKVQLKTGAPEGTLQYPYLAMWATNGTTELVSMNRNGQYTDLEVDYYGLTPGVVYYVSVDNLTGTGYRGTFKLCLSDVPDYNFYEGATDITSLINNCSAAGAYTTVNATADKNKGSAWDTGPNYNRWFKFTASASGYIRVQLNTGGADGTLQYPYLALWATNGTTELTSVNRNGQYTDIEVDYLGLTPGAVYYISVDNLTGTGYRGTFKLCLSDGIGNNYYEGATDVSSFINGCTSDAAYTTVDATPDKNKGSAWDSGPNYNRWFKFIATTTYMKVQLLTGGSEGTLQYPYLALWSTNGTTELVSMNRNGQYTDLEVDYMGLVPGVTYYISVDNLTGLGYRGSFKLCLSDVADYNYYEGAVTLTDLNNWCSADGAYTTVNATPDKNKGALWDTGPNYNRWFKFTALHTSATIQLRTGAPEGTLQYPYLALWASNGTTGLASVNRAGQYVDLSITYNTLVVGNTYYISVDNLTGAGYRGTFKLCIMNVEPTVYYTRADGDWSTTATWSTTGYGGPTAPSPPTVGSIANIRDNAVTVTSGTVQVAGLNISTSGTNTSLTIDNATLQVNGQAAFTNATNNSLTTTIQNAGSLQVANNMTVTRSGGTGALQIAVPGGTLSVGQDLSLLSSAGTVTNNSLTFSNNSTLTVGRDLTLANTGGTKIGLTFNNTAGLTLGRDLTFTASAALLTELIFNNSATMSIRRNIVRGGTPFGMLTFNNTSTLTFNATGNQQVIAASAGSGGDAITYRNVIINNTSGFAIDFTMGGLANILGNLTLTQGIVQTTGANYLALSNASTVNLGSTSSFIDGPMSIDVATSTPTTLNLPLGKSGTYRPLVLNVTHSDATNVTYNAEHFNASAAALGYTLPGSIERVSGVRYWSVTRSAVANLTTATATLYYGIGSTDGVSDPANLRVVKTNGAGTVWFDVGGTGSAAGTGTITSDPFITFSLMTLGNANGGTNTLPIELKSFEAEPRGSHVYVQWITESEVNNDYFDIERSPDGQSFVSFARVAGQGTKVAPTQYGYIDEKPFGGKSYYRLKQTDYDGSSTYSKVVLVEMNPARKASISVQPNPVSGDQFSVMAYGLASDQVVGIRMTDLLGRTVFLREYTTNNSLVHEMQVPRNDLPAGVYVITLWHKEGQVATRLVVR
ncbi:MAG: T9SS type A sorting domain-containing protein [Cyclobacteriaceae bacterium]|nr:T9SS type A sorting domain-containing protein [Cyclobacteriaceae bacterium]